MKEMEEFVKNQKKCVAFMQIAGEEGPYSWHVKIGFANDSAHMKLDVQKIAENLHHYIKKQFNRDKK